MAADTTAQSPSTRTLVVIGAGPGVGLSVARRFGRAGHHVVLLGRDQAGVDELVALLAADGISADGGPVDLLDPGDVRRAVAQAGERHGRIDVLHFNPSTWRERGLLDLTVEELAEDVTFGAGALLPAVQAALPHLGDGARIVVTGSMAADQPAVAAPSLGVQKAAVRTLTHATDATLRDRGIRAVLLQVNGALAADGAFSADNVAGALWDAAGRPDEVWTSFVPYDG